MKKISIISLLNCLHTNGRDVCTVNDDVGVANISPKSVHPRYLVDTQLTYPLYCSTTTRDHAMSDPCQKPIQMLELA